MFRRTFIKAVGMAVGLTMLGKGSLPKVEPGDVSYEDFHAAMIQAIASGTGVTSARLVGEWDIARYRKQ